MWLQPPGSRRYEHYRGTLDDGPQVVLVENESRWWNFSHWGLPGRPAELRTNVLADGGLYGGADAGLVFHSSQYRGGGGELELQDPGCLLYLFSLEPEGRASHVGREAIRVRGWRLT